MRPFILVFAASLIGACSHAPTTPPSSGHISAASVPDSDTASIPKPVQNDISLPKPKPAAKTETYSVVVSNVKAQELLFALARDAKLNIDVHPGINGTVSLNAIDQTLQQLLTRIAKQVDMRWELDGPNLIVMPDTPYLRNYPIDYVNMARDTTVSTSVNSQVSSSGSAGSSGSSSGSSSGNSSTTQISNTSKNHFWETLEKNVKDILRETDKILPEGSSETVIEKSDQQSTTGTGSQSGRGGAQANLAGSPNPATVQTEGNTVVRRTTFHEAASVIVNPESGIVTVRATSRQHEKIQEFLDSIMNSARRQVMIEATIVQVDLNQAYQQGIDWSRVRADGSGFTFSPAKLSTTPSTLTPFTLKLTDNTTPLNRLINISLLENFGTVKVLSSPKLSVLNNQTAVLKVVENVVYFSVKSDVTSGSTGAAQKSFTTTPQTVSVGLVMSVTPEVSAGGSIILNVRPSISSISQFQQDPNPDLTIANLVPQIQTREIESIMRVEDGEIAVLGGLMEERGDYKTGQVPGVGRVPILGELFTQRNNSTTKSELVIFLRPVIVHDPSITGDYRSLKEFLPTKDFNKVPAHAEVFAMPGSDKAGATQ